MEISLRTAAAIASRLLAIVSTLLSVQAGAIVNPSFGCQVKYPNAHLDPSLVPVGNLFDVPAGPAGCAYSFLDLAPRAAAPNSSVFVNAQASAGSTIAPPFVTGEVKVVGDSIGTAGIRAIGIYSIELISFGVPIPIGGMPIIVSGHGNASANASSGSPAANFFPSASASARGTLQISRGTSILDVAEVNVTACAAADGAYCGSLPTSDSDAFDLFTYAFILANSVLSIQSEVFITGISLGDVYQPSANASATVDPYVWIDPTFMVEVDGEMVPANRLFTLVASPGISHVNIPDPAYVPVPASIWLLATGVGLIGARRSLTRRILTGTYL